MSISLLPKYLTESATDISPEFLQQHGIRLLMLDFDNTVVPYTTNIPTPDMEMWLRQMNQANIQLCVVSNSKRERVKRFCEAYQLPCITHARKPFSNGIRRCMREFSVKAQDCALVGDQIYTDVLGANICGVTPILVQAINNHNFWLKARHVLELPFIYFAGKRRIGNEKSE